MTNEQYPSKLLERAVSEFARLPGIGRKTALRLTLHLLRQDSAAVHAFSESLTRLRDEVKYCRVCHNISDTDVCDICGFIYIGDDPPEFCPVCKVPGHMILRIQGGA